MITVRDPENDINNNITDYSPIHYNSVELTQSIALLDAVIEATADAIIVYSMDKYIIKINNRYCEMMGIDKYDAYLHSFDQHLDIFQRHCINAPAFFTRFNKYLGLQKTDKDFVLKFTNNRYYTLTNSPYTINGKMLGRVLAFRDITHEKRTELNLIEREALYKDLSIKDNLTGIYNRRKILLELKQCFSEPRLQKKTSSLIMFDLNDFKTINDTYGHGMGDFVLQRITESISACLRKKDIFGRWGGDEFIILLPDCNRLKAEKTTLKIKNRLAHLGLPLKTPVTCAFGISTTEDETCPEALIHRADMAMYHVKHKSMTRNHEHFEQQLTFSNGFQKNNTSL